MTWQDGLPPVEAVRSIACLMLGEIGDLLVTTPTLRALKQRYPTARLSLIIRSPLAELVASNPDVDEVVAYNNRSVATKVWLMTRLALRSWDLWVDLHTPTFNTWCSNDDVFRRNALLLRLALSRYRLGFAMPVLAPHLTHTVPIPSEDTLQTENIVQTTRRLVGTGEAEPLRKVLIPTPDQEEWADAFLEDVGAAQANVIGLFFGGKQPANCWPEANVVAFCREICHTYADHRFLLFGGPYESQFAERIERQIPECFPQIVNCVGRASLMRTAALMSRCRAVVTTDSGPMHIADAVGVPIVALFSSHNRTAIWQPVTQQSVTLRIPIECEYCLLTVCPHENACMAALEPTMVVTALQQVLAREALLPV